MNEIIYKYTPTHEKLIGTIFLIIMLLISAWFIFYAKMPGAIGERQDYTNVFFIFFLLPVDLFAIAVFLGAFIRREV